MTDTAAAPPGPPPQPMPPAYAAAWELFTDWCTVTSHDPMPAPSSTVLAFLQDCPAAPATQALRIRAITAAHTQAGQPPPSRTPAILDIQRGRSRRPDSRIPLPPGHVDQLLATLPIHGWTAGWFGRRDRALLALAETGLPYRTLARLRLDDVHLGPTGVAITPPDHVGVDLVSHPDPTRCRPCALALWGNALHLASTSATTRVARAVGEAKPLTTDSPHRCRKPFRPTGSDPLLPTSSSWGHLDIQPAPLSPRSLSRLTRRDQDRPHRHHPPAPRPEPPPPVPPGPQPPRLHPLDPAAAAARRHATASALAPLTAVFDAVDAAAAELERRTAALLDSLTSE